MSRSCVNAIRGAVIIGILLISAKDNVVLAATIKINGGGLANSKTVDVFKDALTTGDALSPTVSKSKIIASQDSTVAATPVPLPGQTPPPASSHVQTFKGNWNTFQKGPYWLFNNTWGQPAGTTITVDFDQSITIDTTNFPNNSTIAWDYSKTVPWSGVFGFPQIVFGETPGTPGGWANDTVMKSPGGPWPMQLKNIKTLTITFDFTKTGPTKDAGNVMMEFYVYDVAKPLADGNSKFEIMLLLAPDRATRGYNSGGDAVQFSVPGYSGKVRLNPRANPPIIGFAPTKDISVGTIDVKACVDFLISKGWVSETFWISGLQFGVEPRSNIDGGPGRPWVGRVVINSLSYVWN